MPGTTCTAGLDVLMAVTLVGKVSYSAYSPKPWNAFNISHGESIELSFLVDPTPVVRMGVSDPTQVVSDGTAPYAVCAEDFKIKFEKGITAHLGAPPVDLLGVTGGFFFALGKSRPTMDYAWLSQDAYIPGGIGKAAEETEGIPLIFHGQPAKGQFRASKFQGKFTAVYERYTLPDIDIEQAVGTYTRKGLVSAKMEISRDFPSNIALTAHFESFTISPKGSALSSAVRLAARESRKLEEKKASK